VRRIANVLDKLPRSLQSRAKQALHEIMYAETRAAGEREIARFTHAYGAKYPKAVASLTVDQDRLLAYFDYPADHWKHLRTTNPIESTFATVRLREGVTKGAASRTAGLVMAFKLLQVVEGHWRRIDAAKLVPLVRAGVCFEDGVQIEPQKTRKKPPDLTQSTTLDNCASWYHRGQIAALVRAMGAEPAVTDLVFWARQPR